MAIFRLEIRSLSRSDGRKAVNAAAYRAGERIRDERTGVVFDHSKRTDVLHSAIVLPAALEGREPPWSQTRAVLWNSAERAERRRDARVARDYEVALPAELTQQQRINLTMAFAREIAERYNVIVDTNVHSPRPGSDQRNFHAHLLSTTREATAEGLGKKSNAELSDTVRRQRELPTAREEFKFLRQRWATLTNEALRDAGLEVRVDHRSLAAQGIDREPTPFFPMGTLQAERRGLRSEIADRIRERYRERVAARAARAVQREAHAATQYDASRPTVRELQTVRELPTVPQRPTERELLPSPDRTRGLDGRRGPSLEDVRREAREAWVQFRAKAREEAAASQKGTRLEKGSAPGLEHHRAELSERQGRTAAAAEVDAAL